MLSDVELFIVTWFIGGVSIVSLAILLYSSAQLFMKKTKQETLENKVLSKIRLNKEEATKIKNLSIIIFLLSSITGAIISLVNRIPYSQYNSETAFFRVFSASFGIFLGYLTFGCLMIYIFHIVLKDDKT